ncbi:MAG: hypothetical protein AB1779_11225, partial [Candidatus Thermoplasmatota archaeon]
TWNRGNPLDIIGDANVERYYSVLKILANAEEVHGIIVLVGPQGVTSLYEIAKAIVDVKKTTDKPMTASFIGIVHQESEDYVDSHGIPEFEAPERAVRAMHALYLRGKFLGRGGNEQSEKYNH